jgi:uncharacterized membrane protein
LIFSVLLLAGGAIFLASAHWDDFDAAQRVMVVLFMVAVFHVGGAAVSARFADLSMALHFMGTLACGAGIAVGGQIFQLAEHWPNAILLWAAGAAIAWILLRQWTQAALVAILVPYWLAAEYWMRMVETRTHDLSPVAAGICALSLTYLSARQTRSDSPLRRTLAWLGGIALLPAAFAIPAASDASRPGWEIQAIAWSIAGFLPLVLAIVLRGRKAAWNVVAVSWALLLAPLGVGSGHQILWYLWCILGSIGLALWGARELRPERINLAMAGYAITLIAFYFSGQAGRFGRTAGLTMLCLLFLGGGWFLERTRRRLILHIREGAI